ncbi:MAG: dihydrodipicolinate synthase family protein, partial [Edaphobacter sp.]
AQATREAEIVHKLGYHAVLLNLSALAKAPQEQVLDHVRATGEIVPVIGFYLQPAVGGQYFPVEFWRAFAAIESVVGIKIAPFNRYATQDVLRGVAESGRASEIALYTGNDDHIVLDLLSPYEFGGQTMRLSGGLLGHWAVWTERAVELHREIRGMVESQAAIDTSWLVRNGEVTDMNAALFDVAHHFHGCIAGIHEVLRRQGLLAGRWCLDPAEDMSPGQAEELDRVIAAYPHLIDDEFVRQNLDTWLS